MGRGLAREHAQRRVASRAAAERLRGIAHRAAAERRLVELVVVDVRELEQRVAAPGPAAQRRERLAVARRRRVIADLGRQLDELAQDVGIARVDVVRGLERRERLVELAGAARAIRGLAQRQRAGHAARDAPALRIVFRRRTGVHGRGRIAAQAREATRDRRLADVGLLERRPRDLADRVELRIVEPEHEIRERLRGDRAIAPDRERVVVRVARQRARELREAAGRGDRSTFIAQLQGHVAQRRTPRRIDLERAAMGLQRDVGTAELILQIAEPRQQRLLARGMARGRGDLAAEDDRHALEIAALAPVQLERVERGQVGIGQAQRALEAADRVVGALGAAKQLARAIHRVGACARVADIAERGEALERAPSPRIARALREIREQAQRLAVHVGVRVVVRGAREGRELSIASRASPPRSAATARR